MNKHKKYTDFEEFYNNGLRLAEEVKTKTVGMLANERVNFARNYIMKNIMTEFINISVLSKECVTILETSSDILKFSMDNLIKNLIVHSDVTIEDYKKIQIIAKYPSKIIKSKTNYDVILFKDVEKYYKLVVKTTKNRKENYVKSFHIIKSERYDKY